MAVNGEEYSWEDIQLVVSGSALPLEGIVGIEYTYKKEYTNIHAKGAKPVAGGRGKEEMSATLTVLQSTVEAMQASMPGGKNLVHKSPFVITVGYAPEGGVLVVDQLTYCRITEVKKGMKTGDGNMTVDLAILPGDIQYQV